MTDHRTITLLNPVINPAIAAIKRVEYAATLHRNCGWVPSRKWSCGAPPEWELAQFGGCDGNAPFGNRVMAAA